MTNEKQYSYQIVENGKVIDSKEIDDPFLCSTIRPRGLKSAWRVLIGRYELRVHVSGTIASFRVVFGSVYELPVAQGATLPEGLATAHAQMERSDGNADKPKS